MSLLDLLTSDKDGTASQKRKRYGVAVGFVCDNNDPDQLGRVKVEFPWLADDSEAVTSSSGEARAHSWWVRIATLMAGSRRGTYFIPEVGDEVLVVFEHGDIRFPYVIGVLWNALDHPPEVMDRDGKNNLRSITSRSGHKIMLDDNTEEKKAEVIIQSQGGHTIELDDENDQGKIALTTNAGHSIVLDDAGGTVTIADKSGTQIVLDANASSLTVEINGNQDQTVGGNLTINVSGTATISAPGGVTIDSTSIKLGSSAALTLVNDTFLDIFNTHMHVGNMGAPTSPPAVPAIKNVQSTIFTKGA